jgi:hypothetical protein
MLEPGGRETGGVFRLLAGVFRLVAGIFRHEEFFGVTAARASRAITASGDRGACAVVNVRNA